MNLRNFKPKLLAVAAFTLLSGSVFASVEYNGTPDAQIPVLKTYGVDVPTRNGLKSVLPQGWTLFIHKSVTLPEQMSWKPGDPWTQALEDMAQQQDLLLKLDWDRKTVTIETREVAAAEKAKQQAPVAAAKPVVMESAVQAPAEPVLKKAEAVSAPVRVAVAQSATPKITPITPSTQKVVVEPIAPVAQPVVGASAPVLRQEVKPAQMPVAIRAPEPVARIESAVTGVFPKNGAQAQIGGSAKETVERIAARFNYFVSWEAPDVTIPGALTLLGVDVAEDVKLLQNAIGQQQTPISIEVYRGSSVLHVVPRSMAAEAVSLRDVPFNGTLANAAMGRRAVAPATVAPAPRVVPAVAASVAAPAATVVASATKTAESAPVTLVIQKGDSLTNTLKSFFLAQGWDMQWRAASDLQATYPVTIDAADPKKAMAKLLPKLGLAADFYNPSKLVVIRSADATTN